MRKNTVSEDINVEAVIKRIISAYGAATQEELSKILGVTTSNINCWQQVGSVPHHVILRCALENGVDTAWLIRGESSTTESTAKLASKRGKDLYEQILASGGKGVLHRILDAYGFSMQKELGDFLGISSGTMSTWVRRNYFPGDVVVTCALDTGVSLFWLVTGQGEMKGNNSLAVHSSIGGKALEKYQLIAGQLKNIGTWFVDFSLIPEGIINPAYVDGGRNSWLVDFAVTRVANGRWLIDIDGNLDVYDIACLPENQVRVSGGGVDFQCATEMLKARGLIWLTLTRQG